jgi:hypothetical protein
MSAAGVGILVNPMSGRDVRRLAAHASNMTHETKRDTVARIAAGADAYGATDIFVAKEPFRIAVAAVEQLALAARLHVMEGPITNSALDTERTVRDFLTHGCRVIVVLGGDGTNRAVVRALQQARSDGLTGADEVQLIALSTGTNNVFPTLAEPTIAGMVAALLAKETAKETARGELAESNLARRAKVLHVSGERASDKAHELPDVGLIDAVLLRRDHVGNLLPFDTSRIDKLLLTRAEPGAIGMSPIGGLIEPVSASEDAGLLVEMASPDSADVDVRTFKAPVSPGLFQTVSVKSVTRLPFDVPVSMAGPGVLALDGDRDHKLLAGHELTVQIRRDGPWMIDLDAAMRWAVAQGMIRANLR